VLDKPLRQISNIVADIHQRIRTKEDAGDHKRHTTLMLMSLISSLTIAGAIIVGILHYRSVAARCANCRSRCASWPKENSPNASLPSRPAEFTSLASDFNRMAAELDSLYRQLRKKSPPRARSWCAPSASRVSATSPPASPMRSITRMGIIAGYAELSLAALKQKSPPEAIEEPKKSMKGQSPKKPSAANRSLRNSSASPARRRQPQSHLPQGSRRQRRQPRARPR